jgi:hypothetical protein
MRSRELITAPVAVTGLTGPDLPLRDPTNADLRAVDGDEVVRIVAR